MTEKQGKIGVILLNMGGPERQEDVRPFLYNLFSDRHIIRLGPALLQKPLAWLISSRRAPKSKAMYAQIGGGSPLKAITLQQACALESALRKEGDYVVTMAMRYWPPSEKDALELLLAKGIRRIIALSLYPHFSKATTGSSLVQLKNNVKHCQTAISLQTIQSWPSQPSYIQALAGNIIKGLHLFDSNQVEVLYSAHSLPVSFINEGDPYVQHITETIGAIEEITGKKGRLCYQSRSGPVEWLSPSTPDTLQTLGQEKCKNILMVPISFVSDHIETLYEIDILYKKQAAELGMHLESSASLNTNPLFIQGLKELIIQAQ